MSHVGQINHRSPLVYVDQFQEDLYDFAHVAGWEPYGLRDLAHARGVAPALHIYRSCAASCYGSK